MAQRTLRVSWMAAALVLLSLGLLLHDDPAARAQEGPNPFANPQNLKVLPKDISPEALRAAMVGAAKGLGVRCWFCHVGEEGQDLSTFDFVSDEKPHKAEARLMFQMVMDINANTIPKVAALAGEKDGDAQRVRCVTCHAGKQKPPQDE
jgi:hypothetical protein